MHSLTKKQNSASPNLSSKTATLLCSTSKSHINPLPTNPFVQNKSCILCENKQKAICFPITIHKALYTKFASSQNYYYTREINDILLGNRNSRTTSYRDVVTYDEEAEFMKRFYCFTEFQYKIVILTEYYKYHKDIPRLFMLPITITLNKYLDKKRRFEYIKITKIIKEEQKKDGKCIDEDEFIDSLGNTSSHVPQSFPTVRNALSGKEENILKDFYEEKSKNADVSNFTIHDWQTKLKEITTNSIFIDQSTCSYIEIDQKNESIGNLTKFLEFMKQNSKNLEAKAKINLLNINNQVIQQPLDYKRVNLKEDFQILASIPTNKSAKTFIFEKPQINVQKLSLTKKLALLHEKTKGDIISLTERSENTKKKITELFIKKVPESSQIKRVFMTENRKESPFIKNAEKNKETEKISKKYQDNKKKEDLLKNKENPFTNEKKLKLDQNLLTLLMVNLCKKKEKETRHLSTKKIPQKVVVPQQFFREEKSKSREKTPIIKKKQGFLVTSPKESLSGSNLKSNDQTKPSETKKTFSQTRKSNHNRIFSNDNMIKRNSQPNPLYFDKRANNTNHFRPETSKENTYRSNKANILRSSYNNIMSGYIDKKCLTERSNDETPTALDRLKTSHNNNFHKYTKSEPKLLKKEELIIHTEKNKNRKVIPKNSSSNQFFTYNNNNVVNIFVNENHKKTPSQACFDKIKGNLNKVEFSKKNENLKKIKEKLQLDMRLNLKTEG